MNFLESDFENAVIGPLVFIALRWTDKTMLFGC